MDVTGRTPAKGFSHGDTHGVGSLLSRADCGWLLALARATIATQLVGADWPAPPDAEIPERVRRQQGCFVSLHTRATGALRGCIGTFAETAPLWQQVQAMAVSAATCDPRFPPLRDDELAACDVEISALTPRAQIAAADVRVGTHGLWISRGGFSGVLLPQVATEYGWDAERFLAHTCMKAGLAPDAWRQAGTTIEAFTAQVFSDQGPRTKD